MATAKKISCWKGYAKKGTKKKGNKTVNNCVKISTPKAKDGKWIQSAVKGMRKDKPCTGPKLGSKTCPPGSKRYTLAKTFSKMNKKK